MNSPTPDAPLTRQELAEMLRAEADIWMDAPTGRPGQPGYLFPSLLSILADRVEGSNRRMNSPTPDAAKVTPLTEDELKWLRVATLGNSSPGGGLEQGLASMFAVREAKAAAKAWEAVIDSIEETFLPHLPSKAISYCAQEDVNAGLDALRERFGIGDDR